MGPVRGTLWQKYGEYCYAIAYAALNNAEDADEGVNDTWLEAWSSMPPHRPAVLFPFLGGITRRLSIDQWRRRTAQNRGDGEIVLALDELSDCIPCGRDTEKELEMAELARAIDAFVMSLPDTERRVFLRRYWHFDSKSVICQRFGFSQGKVKMLLHRLRKKLRTYLEKEELL